MFPTAMNSLSVGVFSCKRIAPQLPPLWRDSPSSDWTTKSSFIRRSANFGNVSPFSSSSRGNKHIFRAYPSTLKIAELCFETTAANSTIIWSARLGSAFSLFEKQEQALSAYCHFHLLMFDLPENTTLYTETTLSPHLPYVFTCPSLLLPYSKSILGKKPTVLQSKIRATLAITELYATNEIMIKKHVLFLTWLVRDDIIIYYGSFLQPRRDKALSSIVYSLFEKWFWRVHLRFQRLCNTDGKIFHRHWKIVAYWMVFSSLYD